MMRLVSTLAASTAGKAAPEASDRSTTVMEHVENSGRRVRARAVLRPNTPEPTMRMDDGGEKVVVLVFGGQDGEEGEEEEESI